LARPGLRRRPAPAPVRTTQLGKVASARRINPTRRRQAPVNISGSGASSTTAAADQTAATQGQPSLGTSAGSQTGTGSQSSLSSSTMDRTLSQSVTNSLMTAGIPSQTLQNIHIRAMNGRVILTGPVSSQDEKQRIETQVKQIPGVQAVSNLLRVQSGTGTSSQSTTSTLPGADSSGTGTSAGQSSGSTPPR
jgi:broad specificity polyphosphatase/5'/3'-nucleotidase SurE